MIRYYLYQWQAKGNLQGLWFARAASDETLNLEALSEHMHSHNCPYSQGTILGVLRDAVKCTKELLLEGKKVKFDNLALFSVGIKGTGVLNQKEYSVQKNVDGLRLLARATGDLSTTRLDQAGVVAQAKIVVGAKVEHFLTFHLNGSSIFSFTLNTFSPVFDV